MRILVLQLARLGDVLQTLPTIQGLKKSHPGCHVTLVVRNTFADAARLSPHVDKLVEFPSAKVLGPYLENPSDDSRADSLARLARWVRAEVQPPQPYDVLLNLTFSPASSFLASIVPARDKRGLRRLRDGSYAISDPWSQYLFSQVLGYNMNIIHLNDLFMRVAQVGKDAWPVELAEAPADDGPGSAPLGRGPCIGIQLTASRADKTLGIEAWSTVCAKILDADPGVELVFFGSAADLPAIEATQAALGPRSARCRTLAGTLRFHQNTAWVRACGWIVAPDTALVHLASLCGTRVIQVAVGPVKPEETGPYGNGHHVLYSRDTSAGQLGVEIARLIAGNPARPTVAHSTTRLAATSTGVPRNELVPANFAPDEAADFFARSYYLLAEFRCSGRQEDIEIPKLGRSAQPGALDRLVAAYDGLCTVRRLAEFGQHFCLQMLENIGDATRLKDLMAKLAEIESLLANAQKTIPLVKPLIDNWRVGKDVAYVPSENVGEIEGMLALSEGCYRELGQNVEIVQQLLQTAVEAAHATLGKGPAAGKRKTKREEPKERV